jgi:hypothetical protein
VLANSPSLQSAYPVFNESFLVMQAKLSMVYFDIMKGDATKTGMLIKRKAVWKGASADMAKPDPKPASEEIKVPAQVGQPTNKPVVAPIPLIAENRFLFVPSFFARLIA